MPRVLVVDDDRAIRELLQFALQSEGYTVDTLADGRQVVETLAAREEPCVVLLDLSMPWVSGWDVCQRLSADAVALGQHQLVILTAEPLEDGACPAPARALVRKPFDLFAVYDLVASLFALPGMVATHAPAAIAATTGPLHACH